MHRWLFAFSLVASVAGAQTGTGTTSAAATPGTIDPGMSKAQVIERLGKPATVRDYQGTTYLLYPNACGKTCGMQDLVILDHDVVVDAVFRSPNRHYTGTSSSPDATKPNARSARNQPLAVPAAQEAQPTAAERVTPGHSREPADSAKTSTSTAPRDSSRTPTSMPPRDSARTPTSYPPADSAPPRQGPAPYGKPSPTPPPADSASSSTSHPPADNSTSATSHPPKPPK